MTEQNTLDARAIEPAKKHPTIFQTYAALEYGSSFILLNDHDPKPLFYQFQNDYPGQFTWEYLEQGPEKWRVAIGKIMAFAQVTVGEIIADDFRKAEVFKRHGIDFCCGGSTTIAEASQMAGMDIDELLSELNEVKNSIGSSSLNRFGDWPMDFLIRYILENHHNWLKTKIPDMLPVVQKVAGVHGVSHPETIEISNLFQEMVNDLIPHMQKEEIVLFPYLENLIAAKNSGNAPPAPFFGSIENPLSGMEADHEAVGSIMASINKLSHNYTVPEDACSSFQLVYSFLAEFEADLHQHIHLENNILFPKARALAKDLGV